MDWIEKVTSLRRSSKAISYRTRSVFRSRSSRWTNAGSACRRDLLLLCVVGHLFVQFCKLLRLDGQFIEGLHEVLAMVDRARLRFSRQTRIRLIRRNHLLVFLRLSKVILRLRLVVLS